MKKYIIILGALVIGTTLVWHNRVNLLVWGLPIVKDITDHDKTPVEMHENQPELFPVYSVALVGAVL